MDHQWVKNWNRISPEYVEGIKEFLNVARQNLNSKGLTLCPCFDCLNTRYQSIDVIRAHLISVGINDSYTRWVYHGEKEVDEESVGNEDFVTDELDGSRTGLHNTIGDQFFNVGPIDDLARNKQSTAEEARYEKLWPNSTCKERSKRNAKARGKHKRKSRKGSKSTARHHVAQEIDLNASTGQIETWRIRNWHSKRGWISPLAADKYEEMMQLRRDNPLEEMTDKEILERVIGQHSVDLFGWGRSPSTSNTTSSNGDLRRPSYTQLLNTVNHYESRLAELERTIQNMQHMLAEKNIIPPPPMPYVPSDHSSGPS